MITRMMVGLFHFQCIIKKERVFIKIEMNILDCSTDSTDTTDSNGSVGFAIDTTP